VSTLIWITCLAVSVLIALHVQVALELGAFGGFMVGTVAGVVGGIVAILLDD